MKVLSVNVGLPRVVRWKGVMVETGIFKSPVQGHVPVSKLNLAGDRQADLTVHGGYAKAVYGYPSEHYEFWRQEFADLNFEWGQFGENLTTLGLEEEELFIGDRLRVGTAILTVTQPRLPCYKLQVKFGRDDIIKRFVASGRSGFYFSVEEEGELAANSPIEFLSRDPQGVSVADIQRLFLGKTRDKSLLERTMKLTALPESWKDDLLARAGY